MRIVIENLAAIFACFALCFNTVCVHKNYNEIVRDSDIDTDRERCLGAWA